MDGTSDAFGDKDVLGDLIGMNTGYGSTSREWRGGLEGRGLSSCVVQGLTCKAFRITKLSSLLKLIMFLRVLLTLYDTPS